MCLGYRDNDIIGLWGARAPLFCCCVILYDCKFTKGILTMLKSDKIKVGARIYHNIYKNGTIEQVSEDTVSIRFDNEINKSFPLKKALVILQEPKVFAETEADNKNKTENEMNQALKKPVKKLQARYDAKAASDAWVSRQMMGNDPGSPWYDPERDIDVSYTGGMNYGVVTTKPVHSVDAFVKLAADSLTEEIDVAKKGQGAKYHLSEGRLVERGLRGGYIYFYETDAELHLPEGSDIKIWLSVSESQFGSVVSCSDYSIMFYTGTSLGDSDSLPDVEISSSPWQLLDHLKENILQLRNDIGDIARQLILDGFNNIDGSAEIIKGQSNAESMAKTQDITFVWGPPGTGKTTVLADIARDCLKEQRRVLMVSYSNVAVDDATIRVFANCNKSMTVKPGDIIRYGYPRDEWLLNHEYITSYNMALSKNPALLEERDLLLKRLKGLRKDSGERKRINDRLGEIRKSLSDEEKKYVMNAVFVATTVAKAVSDTTISSAYFDTVLFDEASMAYIPQIIYAANMAKAHFVCLGDFCQLPPIVQSGKKGFLNADIFTYCGIKPAVDKKWGHKWLCLLNVQHRMHPSISEVINSGMYAGLLENGEELSKDEDRNKIVSYAPFVNEAIGIIDVSDMHVYCRRTREYSHYNLLTSFIDYATAVRMVSQDEKIRAGIIAPYNVQARLIMAMIRDTYGDDDKDRKVVAATVHQFQGSEKSVIIYDQVDSYPLKKAGGLLVSTENNTANRLFNVALSRAESKLIVVSDRNFVLESNIPSTNLFKKLLLKIGPSELGLHALSDELKSSSLGRMGIFQWEQSLPVINRDISNATKSIFIEVSKPFLVEDDYGLKEQLIIAGEKKVNIRIRIKNGKMLSERLQQYSVETEYACENVIVIDDSVTWYIGEGNIADDRSHTDCFAIKFDGRLTSRMITNLMYLKGN